VDLKAFREAVWNRWV